MQRAAQTLVVLSTPRAGTHLLAHQLVASGLFGMGDEYFHDELQAGFASQFGGDPDDLSDYWRHVSKATQSQHRVATVVVFDHHLRGLAARNLIPAGPSGLAALLSHLPEPTVVTLTRRSLVAQAISFARATSSDSWLLGANESPPEHPPYDFEAVLAHLTQLQLLRERAVEAEKYIPRPVVARLEYESIVATPSAAPALVAGAMGLPKPGQGPINPGDHGASAPVRAGDDESARRIELFIEDLGALNSTLGWKSHQGNDGVTSVAEVRLAKADRRVAILTEVLETERRATHDPTPRLSPSNHSLRRALHHSRRRTDALRIVALVHGLTPWEIERFYGAAGADLDIRLVERWSELTHADLVHVNSVDFGWASASHDRKSQLVQRALTTIDAVAHSNASLCWTAHNPMYPGTRHLRLELEVRKALGETACLVHAETDSIIDAARERSGIAGTTWVAPSTDVRSAPDRTVARDSLGIAPEQFVVVVSGCLGDHHQLAALEWMAKAVQSAFAGTFIVAGMPSGQVDAAVLRALERSGAVVARGSLSPDDHARLVAAADVNMAPVHGEAFRNPVASGPAGFMTRAIVTAGPSARPSDRTVSDWSDQTEVLGEVRSLSDAVAPLLDADEHASPSQSTINDLVEIAIANR